MKSFANKSRTITRVGLGTVLTLLLALCWPALAHSPMENESPWQKPPFTAEQFWDRLFQVIAEHEGYVTKHRLEQLFEMKFSRTVEFAPGHVKYLVARNTDWYMDVALTEDGSNSFLDISWLPQNFPGPAPHCVLTNTVRTQLTQLGWRLAYSDRHILVFDQFIKNGNSLTMFFAGDCVNELRFGGVNNGQSS